MRWSGGFGRLDVDRPDRSRRRPRSRAVGEQVDRCDRADALGGTGGSGSTIPSTVISRRSGRGEWRARDPITIRQLLTHTAGLPMSLGGARPDPRSAGRRRGAYRGGARHAVILRELGYDVAGYLVSRLAAMPWDAACATRCSIRWDDGRRSAATPGRARRTRRPGHAVSQFDGTVMRLDPPDWPFDPGPPRGVGVERRRSRALSDRAPQRRVRARAETFADMHRLHAPLGAVVVAWGSGSASINAVGDRSSATSATVGDSPRSSGDIPTSRPASWSCERRRRGDGARSGGPRRARIGARRRVARAVVGSARGVRPLDATDRRTGSWCRGF